MSNQLELDFETETDELRESYLRRLIAWRKFHAENPEIWTLFEKFAFQAVWSGRDRYSPRAIAHRIRWHVDIETRGDVFKLNNNHIAFYAREFESKHPKYRGFFRLREQKGSDDDS